MKAFLIPVAFMMLACSSLAQTIVIKKIELIAEKMIIHYDLDDSNPNNAYLLNLYASKDEFATPLTKVAGDIGQDIRPGIGKRVEWFIMQEYGGFKGKLSLEIRGRVYVPFVRAGDFTTMKSYKRGRSYDIGWKPGSTNPINIELYKGAQRVTGEMNQPNNGKHAFFVPAHAKPGKGYRLKITDSRNNEEFVYTSAFHVRARIPLLVKVLPVAVIGGVVTWLITREKPDKDPDINNPPFPN